MSLDQYHHGVRVVEVNEGTRPIRTVATSIIGLVATAPDADEATFPLDTAVLLANPQSYIGKAGITGTLKKALESITKQTNPMVVVVRVEQLADAAEQTAAVIGTVTAEGKYTGLQALLTAQTKLKVKPRILGAPDLDTTAVAVELVSIAQKLRAFAYVEAHDCATKEDATAYRDTFSAREVMVIHSKPIAYNVSAVPPANQSYSPVAFALGLRAKIDNETGWHKTLSNVGINGVLGITQDLYWDLQSPDTDVGYLNANEVTAIIQADGFRFWGNRTCSDDALFAFENYVRTAQVLADTIAEAHMWAVDKPMHASLVTDIIEGINAKFRELKAGGYIIGAEAYYDPARNDETTLKAGKLRISYRYTPVPPLEDLGFIQEITDEYLADFASQITA